MNYRFYYLNGIVEKTSVKTIRNQRNHTRTLRFWYGVGKRNIRKTKKSIQRLLKRASLLVLVIYSIPNRDLGHHSKGGIMSMIFRIHTRVL